MIPGMMRSVMLVFLAAACASAQNAALKTQVESVFPDAQALYLDLHQHPELSLHETRTAGVMAEKLRGLGYEVTEHVGGMGIVAVMKTGLPYASKVKAKDDSGRDVGVMHACGHDVHMASLYGTAAIMAKSKDTWHGTLVLVGQPAEEIITGASKMIVDGLFTKFPRPDIGVAMHDENGIAVGQVGITPGYAKAAA